MPTELFSIENPAQFTLAVAKAAEVLRRGDIVAVPTETVYGLAANALNESAVQRIYEAKGRPRVNPIIVHISSQAMAAEASRTWPESAQALASAFWPGPLTMVVGKSDHIPAIVSAGGDTVGLRWPSHPFMQELIRACEFPLAAPSANRSNEISPTSGQHVARALDGRVPLIIDAGPCNVGIESTVLDLTSEPPRILRAGMISAEEISQVLGGPVLETAEQGSVLKSPGLLSKHYSPRARLITAHWNSEAELRQLAKGLGTPLGKISVIAHDRIPQSTPFGRVAVIPHDPEAYARALYAELHQCDAAGAEAILVESVPDTSRWAGIRDRLKRASATL